jgi:hypothetical protein
MCLLKGSNLGHSEAQTRNLVVGLETAGSNSAARPYEVLSNANPSTGLLPRLTQERSDNFSSLRVVSYGESISTVDWRASAKSDRLIARLYHTPMPQGPKKVEIILDLALFYRKLTQSMYMIDRTILAQVIRLVADQLKDRNNPTLSVYSTGALLEQLSHERLREWSEGGWWITIQNFFALSALFQKNEISPEYAGINLGHVSQGALDSFELNELLNRVTREKSTFVLCTAPSRIKRHSKSTDQTLQSLLRPKGQFVELPLK